MNAELFNSLDLLEKESGISKEYMLAKIEEALANACRKEVGSTALIRVNLDPVKLFNYLVFFCQFFLSYST